MLQNNGLTTAALVEGKPQEGVEYDQSNVKNDDLENSNSPRSSKTSNSSGGSSNHSVRKRLTNPLETAQL